MNGHSVIGLGAKQARLSEATKLRIYQRVTKTKAIRSERMQRAKASTIR